MARHEELRDLLHDLRNVLGIVHACAVDLREAHAAGEELGPRLRDLESLAALATEVLRALGPTGRAARPFELRAALICARGETSTLALGELLVPLPVDAEAGALIDFVVALAHGLAPDGERLDVSQDADGTLLFSPTVPTPTTLAEPHAALTDRAAALGLSLTITPTSLALRPL